MIGDTSEPVGSPSLTDQEIIFLYNKYLGRPPDSGELASERENALKYSAAGIERQIANRASNVSGSGLRGDEGLAPLTMPAPLVSATRSYVPATQAGNVMTMGPAGALMGSAPMGPLGLMSYQNAYAQRPASGGLSMTTVLVIAAVIAAAFYLTRAKK